MLDVIIETEVFIMKKNEFLVELNKCTIFSITITMSTFSSLKSVWLLYSNVHNFNYPFKSGAHRGGYLQYV
jgi:hypothetical protein